MRLRIPCSTYRLQLHHEFDFVAVENLLDYLDALGITDVYLSPILAALKGSRHGYDVIDPETINPELGGEAKLQALADSLKKRNMGLLLDIVPNHMCVAGGQNAMWLDVLENGQSSPYASVFDIDWNPPKPDLMSKVLLPILGDQYGLVLERQELQLKFIKGAFDLAYYDLLLPLAPKSWIPIIDLGIDILRGDGENALPSVSLLESIQTALKYLPTREETNEERLRERKREKEVIKARLGALVEECKPVKEALTEALKKINGIKGQPRSFDFLDNILNDQAYRLAYWRVATDEINYRRFFDINELAAVRIEDPKVFNLVHNKIFEYIKSGCITGLRLDHVDGLYDPTEYLRNLQAAVANELSIEDKQSVKIERDNNAIEPNLYVVAEKILAKGEEIPRDWPIHGTTGYDFLNSVGNVFIDSNGAKNIRDIYYQFTGQWQQFEDIEYHCKQLILKYALASQVAMLGRQLDRISEQDRHSRDFTLESLQEALEEILAHFPVYRTYERPDGVITESDRRWIGQAITAAVNANPAASESVFRFIHNLLIGAHPAGLSEGDLSIRKDFVLRLQQITGPVMAKAIEDTAFYRFFPLASQCEVGGNPDLLGISIEEFHNTNITRLNSYPHSLLTTTTHDTKRSEDVRARIQMLSEVAQEWSQAIEQFMVINAKHKSIINGLKAPDANEEYLLYQTLVGIWPLHEMDNIEYADTVNRIQTYMQKALREAKVHTSWVSPNINWEDAVSNFINRTLDRIENGVFSKAFMDFILPVARAGMYASLAQVILKITCPGVPDFYQGNELWNLCLVDPDNRRAVNFDEHHKKLNALDLYYLKNDRKIIQKLIDTIEDGTIKMYIMARGLHLRRNNHELFMHGSYIPLNSSGIFSEKIIAFARTASNKKIITLVARHFLSLFRGKLPNKSFLVNSDIWKETYLELPDVSYQGMYRNIITDDQIIMTNDNKINIYNIFKLLPMAILEKVQ
ncbi:MAG: malto-oligosyltrehalose synthase [Deltaproteobacteria bacterium]|nr:malto-oligosyltrehalose synthase [Deltaproteobacteria bacterium]